MKLVPAWITRPRSRLRGSLFGLAFSAASLVLLGRIGGEATHAFVKAHDHLAIWGFIFLASWMGYHSYKNANPLRGMFRNIRELGLPAGIVGPIAVVALVVFRGPIKGALEQALPDSVSGLAAAVIFMFIISAWYVESWVRALQDELRSIRLAIDEISRSRTNSRLPF